MDSSQTDKVTHGMTYVIDVFSGQLREKAKPFSFLDQVSKGQTEHLYIKDKVSFRRSFHENKNTA